VGLTKNYTGPTMARLAVQLEPPTPDFPIVPLRTIVMPVWAQFRRRLTMTARMAPAVLIPPDIEIPPPPLGKLIFSTFPAAYKARVTRRWQVYPCGLL